MKKHSLTPDNTTAASVVSAQRRILLWDAPVRIFHWLMVACFAGAVITQEAESLRLWHIAFGYTMLGLVIFRIVWGFVGTQPARFTRFFPTPKRLKQYLFSRAAPNHKIPVLTHNPIGAIAVFAILTLTLAIVATGAWVYEGFSQNEDWYEVHETLGKLMILIVLIHIGGVIVTSYYKRERLIPAMIHGYKTIDTIDPQASTAPVGAARAYWPVALTLLAGALYFLIRYLQP